MEHSNSERQLLINRVQKIQISDRIKHNLEDIEIKQERLSLSRVSSTSAKSFAERKLKNSVDVKTVSPKVKLLKDISEKLKQSKEKLFQTPTKSPKKDPIQVARSHQTKFNSSQPTINNSAEIDKKPKSGKLESMLKDIKRCNQMSTKAVSSIKKHIHYDGPLNASVAYNHTIQASRDQPRLGNMFHEMLSLKQQLRRVKQENRLLVKLIEINEIKNRALPAGGQPCQLCGCTCNGRKLHYDSVDKCLKYSSSDALQQL